MEHNKEFTTNCIDCLDFYYIFNSCDISSSIRIVITRITEEEEKDLDNNKSILIKRGSNQFDINPDNCIAFGDLDLSPNSKDIKTLCNSKVFSNFDINLFVLSKYNYDTHTVTSDIRGGRWHTTKDPNVFLPYIHGCIGKPERVVIFKEYENILSKSIKKKNKTKTNKETKENKTKTNNTEKRKEKVSKYKFTIKKK